MQPTLLHVRQKKRRVFVGSPETWANTKTGEVIDVTPTTIVAGDDDFQKFWIANILAAVDEISNAKIKVLWYILRSIDPMTNYLFQSCKEIAQGCHVSQDTVIRTLKVLHANDVIRRRRGMLQLNPDVMMKGSPAKRRAILIRFEQLELPLAGGHDLLPPETEQRALRAV